jgi:membrane fusion protein, multidrug efflux system
MKRAPLLFTIAGLVLAGTLAWYVQREARQPAAGAASSPGVAATVGTSGSGAPSSKAGSPGGPGGAQGSGPAVVEVGSAVAARLNDDTQAVGTIRARRSVILRPEISGRVALLDVADGARVRKGQLLAQLDDTLQQAQLKQAEAQAAIARTNLQRSRELANQNFVSQSAVDQNAAALDVALAQVALMQAQITRTRILAPFDGVAGIRTAQLGDYLKDGADIVTLDDVGAVYLDFRLPERYVPQIKAGRTVEAQLDALPGRRFTGIVTALDSQIDANGRALLVRAELKNADGALRPGMFARARVVFGTLDKAILVPEEALVPLAGNQYIYKVVQGKGGLVSQKLEAKIGLRRPGQVQIVAGLVEGDRVVTAGHARLARGDNLPIRVVDIEKPSGPPSAQGRPASGAGTGGLAAKPAP